MMQEDEDSRFDKWLKDQAQSYHSPRPTPREEIWARIKIERARRAARRVIELRPWLRWTLAAAAVLVLGIGIGHWTAGPDRTSSVEPQVASTAPGEQAGASVVYQVAATEYLSRTEAFLTGFRADLRSGRTNARFVGQARDLLTTTRLLLDSPAADNQRLRVLLEDLELVLVQISQLGAGRDARDTDLITQGMDQRSVLPKLRTAIPAGPVPVRTEGAL